MLLSKPRSPQGDFLALFSQRYFSCFCANHSCVLNNLRLLPWPRSMGGTSTGGAYAPIHDAENRPITAGGTVEKGPVVFEDTTRSSGLSTWKYTGGTAAKALIVESLGGGVALLDYDNDGWLDIYLSTG